MTTTLAISAQALLHLLPYAIAAGHSTTEIAQLLCTNTSDGIQNLTFSPDFGQTHPASNTLTITERDIFGKKSLTSTITHSSRPVDLLNIPNTPEVAKLFHYAPPVPTQITPSLTLHLTPTPFTDYSLHPPTPQSSSTPPATAHYQQLPPDQLGAFLQSYCPDLPPDTIPTHLLNEAFNIYIALHPNYPEPSHATFFANNIVPKPYKLAVWISTSPLRSATPQHAHHISYHHRLSHSDTSLPLNAQEVIRLPASDLMHAVMLLQTTPDCLQQFSLRDGVPTIAHSPTLSLHQWFSHRTATFLSPQQPLPPFLNASSLESDPYYLFPSNILPFHYETPPQTPYTSLANLIPLAFCEQQSLALLC